MSRELPVLANYGLIPKLPEAFDHQVTGSFQECHRMGYYKHILSRQVNRQDRTALNWGSAFHGATEVWDTTDHNAEAVQEYIETHLDENIEDRYGRTRGRMFTAFLEWAKWAQLNPIKILRTEQPVLVQCMDGDSCPYFPRQVAGPCINCGYDLVGHHTETGTCVHGGILEDATGYEPSPGGCGLTYGGRIDRVVEWQGMVGPLDKKTTVMDETDPISEYRPNHQFMGYVWAVSHLMNLHSWGIIVERMVTNKSKIKFDRFPVSFTRDQIREWVETEKLVQQEIHDLFAKHPNDELAWTQNYFRCFKPWPCEFRDACLSPRDMGFRYRWLRDNTTEKRWDFRNPDGKNTTVNEVV